MSAFNGLFVCLQNVYRLSAVHSRSISPENFSGAKGGGGRATEGNGALAARDLGRGWKISPSICIDPGQTCTLCDIDTSSSGGGAIQHIWMTVQGNWRFDILRIYWDDQEQPSVECPLGDFFACGWNQYAHVNSAAICVNPGLAFNSYWPMPFRKRCRMTLTNLADEQIGVYYQIDYGLGPVPDDAAYFHAQFRRVNPLPYKQVYTILDGVRGRGHYVGTYMAWAVLSNRWWGEGEIKFYLDGDWPPGAQPAEYGGDAFPTICSTGTEDYFCGAYNFDVRTRDHRGDEHTQYQAFNTSFAGLPQIIRGDGHYQVQQRFGMYRWHIPDPIRFEQDLAVTIQALGVGRSGHRYLPHSDDIASVAYWYQTLPTAPFPTLPDRDSLEII